MAEQSNWRKEHGEGYDVPQELSQELASLGFWDESWKNDACPVFRRALGSDLYLEVWCDHPRPEEREVDTGVRFSLCSYNDQTGESEEVAKSDDWKQIIEAIRRHLEQPTVA